MGREEAEERAQPVLHDERAVLPVSSVLRGELGLRDVALSLPSVLGRGGVERVLEVTFDDAEKAMFDKSVASVTGLIEACKGVDSNLA